MDIGIYRHISPLNFLSEKRIDAYLNIAKEMNLGIFFFEDEEVDIKNSNIMGKINIGGEWITQKFNFPEIIINESGLTLDRVTEVGKELRKQAGFSNSSISSYERIVDRIKDEQEFVEYVENVQKTDNIIEVYLQCDLTDDWIVKGIQVINEMSYRNTETNELGKEDFESFVLNRFGDKLKFYSYYVEALSIDLAKHIRGFYKRKINELLLTFSINEDNEFKLVDVTNNITRVENEIERARNLISFARYKLAESKVNDRITVGMLVKTKKNPSIFKKFNNMKFACASVAKIRNLDFFFFTSEDVKYKQKKIRGYIYNEKGNLVRKTFSYPDVIIDRLRMRGIKGYEKIYTEFSDIPFNNERDGGAISKSETYDIISKSPIFNSYLIPYRKVTSTDDILDFVKTHNKIILKPSVGSFGDDIICIEAKAPNEFQVELGDEKSIKNMEELQEFVDLYSAKPMVVQEFIESKTKHGAPFDVRIHILKDDKGEWNVANIYPRIGSVEGITSNLSSGGSTSTWASFFKHEFPEYEWKDFNRTLMEFSVEFCKFFETEINRSVNEIAIDIGIDRNKMQLMFFEINVNIPGCRFHTLEAAYYIVSYAEFLVKEARRKKISTIGQEKKKVLAEEFYVEV